MRTGLPGPSRFWRARARCDTGRDSCRQCVGILSIQKAAKFLALRELRFARGRFTLMGAVIALISVLVVLLSGLSSGLVNDGVSGLKALPATGFASTKAP